MVVPWISINTMSWKYKNTIKLFDSLWNINLSHLINNLVVIHAKDDEVVPFRNWKKFAEKVWAEFIELENWWHSLEWYLDLIISKLKD